MKVLPVFLMFIIVACSSSPTPYGPSKDSKGYSDQNIDSDLRLAIFQGNSSTKKETAELYAKFRAIEICQELGRPLTHIVVVKDKTYSKEVVTANTVVPSYYYGASPYYGRYGGYGPGMGMSYSTATTTTSSESYTYPLFEVYFECVDKPLDARISLSNLSSSQMQAFVKDLKGGVQVDDVLSDSPNKGRLQKTDIITKANGERISTVLEAFQAARKAKQKNLKAEFFREGVKKETMVRFLDVTELVRHAQDEIIKKACKEEAIKESNPICK